MQPCREVQCRPGCGVCLALPIVLVQCAAGILPPYVGVLACLPVVFSCRKHTQPLPLLLPACLAKSRLLEQALRAIVHIVVHHAGQVAVVVVKVSFGGDHAPVAECLPHIGLGGDALHAAVVTSEV